MAGLDRGRRGIPDEERLPWLEAVDPVAERRQLPVAAILLGTAALLLFAAVVAMSLKGWLHRGAAAPGGVPGFIAAPPGPYKVKPDDVGGMDVEGEGYASYAASQGGEPDGALDLSAVPEAPMKPPAARAAPAAAAAPDAPPAPAATPTGPASIVQLGAFSSEAKANAAWKAMTGRFAFLQPLTPVILAAKVGDQTMYRLRANPGDPRHAAQICGRLRVAGETCLVVGG